VGLWHDERMVWLVRIVVGLLSDAFRLVVLLLHSAVAIRVENLVLRKQLAQYMERGIKPRRVDFALRVSLAVLTRLFDRRRLFGGTMRAGECSGGGSVGPGDRRFQQNCGC
jgi:hypothetical protein